MERIEKAVQEINDNAGRVLLDWISFQKACLGKIDLIVKILNLFIMQTPGWIDEFKESVRSQDQLKIRLVCHTVKGATAAMHAVSCVESIERLHQVSTSEDVGGIGVQEALEQVCCVLRETMDAGKKLLDILNEQ